MKAVLAVYSSSPFFVVALCAQSNRTDQKETCTAAAAASAKYLSLDDLMSYVYCMEKRESKREREREKEKKRGGERAIEQS